ncbi:hypothetical protein HDU67_002429, partial [Dinochytrium kinnereticum]
MERKKVLYQVNLLARESKIESIKKIISGLSNSDVEDFKKRLDSNEEIVYSDAEKKILGICQQVQAGLGGTIGSQKSKMARRLEIKSAIRAFGAPFAFVTFSPLDHRNQMCMRLAGVELFKLSTMSQQDKTNCVANNPVACARFFWHMVQLFVSEIVRVGDIKQPGAFGPVDHIYGTVEQQGRLTLHYHVLLWSQNFSAYDNLKVKLQDPTYFLQFRSWAEDAFKSGYDFEKAMDENMGVEPCDHLPQPVSEKEIDDSMSFFNIEIEHLVRRHNKHTCSDICGGKKNGRLIEGGCKKRFPRK